MMLHSAGLPPPSPSRASAARRGCLGRPAPSAWHRGRNPASWGSPACQRWAGGKCRPERFWPGVEARPAVRWWNGC